MSKSHSRAGKFSKSGENLYRYTSNGIYYAVFRSKGKLIWKSLKTDDRALAKRRLKEEIEKQTRIDPKASKMSLDALLKQYDASLEQLDGKTIQTRRSILKVFRGTWTYGLQLEVRDITSSHLEIWVGQHRKRLKKSSYNEYLRFLRQLFEIAVKSRVVAESPAAHLKELKREKPIRETPTWDQFQSIVQSIRSQKFSAEPDETADLVEFMGQAGAGTAEAANLRGEHISLAEKKIRFYRSKTDTGFCVPIFPQVLPLLERLQHKGRLETGQRVFHVRSPKKALASACVRLGLANFSPRALRRCFITRAIELGVDFKTIASWQDVDKLPFSRWDVSNFSSTAGAFLSER